MIQAKDLRLGNLINYKGKQIEVRTNDIGLLHEYERVDKTNESFTPIPLTPEILEKAGFAKCLNADDDLIYRKEYIDVEYFQFCAEEDNGFYYRNGSPNETKISSVNQLQNLYHALTGQELEINLTPNSAKPQQ